MTFFTFSWGKNYIAIRGLLKILGHELETPPKIDDATIQRGVKESAPFLCFSGKVVIGQLFQQLEMGRLNFLYLSSLGVEACRCAGTGPYLEGLARKRFPGLRFFRLGGNTSRESLEAFLEVFPETSKKTHNEAFLIYFLKLALLDRLDKRGLFYRTLSADTSGIEALELRTIEQIDKRNNILSLFWTGFVHELQLQRFKKIRKTPKCKIGLVGGEHILSELDSMMARIKSFARQGVFLDWRSGFFLINRLADKEHPDHGRNSANYLRKKCGVYLGSESGGTEILSCARAVEFAEEKYDGILHIYAFGCLPQTTVIPALQKISRDYSIPLLSVVLGERFDVRSLETKLTAFLDILQGRKTKENRT